jgi:Ca2+-transporting ATPase
MPLNATEDAAGLSTAEAQARLLRHGPNSLPSPERKSLAGMVLSAAGQPMVLLLLACTLLYALLGSAFDSVVLSLSIGVVIAISVYQEQRTQRVLEALRELSSPRSTVIRDGAVLRIASHELVEGDRLLAQEGDRLACDARLVEAHSLRIDESLLTGESVPIDKAPSCDADMLYAGTLVVQGDGVAIVTATATRTALGRIGGSLAAVQPRSSRLHEELKRLVRAVALLALATCLMATTLFAWRDGSWSAGMLVGLTLAMSIVPEEFAVVWTVMLALGAWRLAQVKVLTRQPQAIEALGSTTVLCVDKTGTLTCNRMAVVALFNGEQAWARQDGPLPAGFEALLRSAALASVKEGLEPMDQAIFRILPASVDGDAHGDLVHRSAVTPGRPFVVQAWRGEGGQAFVAIKGAAEAVMARCAGGAEQAQGWVEQARRWGDQGLRVIAVGRATIAGAGGAVDVPDAGYEALGLIGLLDPLRDDVLPALQECRSAGVRVMMITGDSPATAVAIARQAELVGPHATERSDALNGQALDGMNDAQLELAVKHVSVFARVTPAQKLRIVQALQRRGEVVAMTGDGVNDGPALRAADIGVAMGERGTDVAREAASLVLMDDRFSSLVDAVRAGRRIFINLQHALGYLFAVHVPIVGLSMLPLFGGPVLLLPIHVVLLELIIDPACSLVFEAEPLPPDGMHRPPRAVDAPLFSTTAIVRALLVGACSFATVVLVQWLGHREGLSDDALRLAALATIVVGNLVMLQWFRGGLGRSARMNRAFHGLLLGVCVIAAAVLLISPVSAALGFPAITDAAWVLAVLAPVVGWSGWHLGRSRSRAR